MTDLSQRSGDSILPSSVLLQSKSLPRSLDPSSSGDLPRPVSWSLLSRGDSPSGSPDVPQRDLRSRLRTRYVFPFLGWVPTLFFVGFPNLSCQVSRSLTRIRMVGLIFWNSKYPVVYLMSFPRRELSPPFNQVLLYVKTRIDCFEFSGFPSLNWCRDCFEFL